MELLNRIEELEKELLELKELVKEEQDFPQDEDKYWYMDINGDVVSEKWHGGDIEKGMLEIGNVFKTSEEAEDAVEKFRTEEGLRDFSRPFINGEDNYHIILIDGEAVQPDMWTIVQSQGAIYFESKEKTEEAIQAVGEKRIKKYIFGLED